MRSRPSKAEHEPYWDFKKARRSNRKARRDELYICIIDGFPPRKKAYITPGIERDYDLIIMNRRSMAYYIRSEETDRRLYGKRLSQ